MPRGARPGERRGGRTKGTPNKITAEARAAIATFVEGNAHRLQVWLDLVADGVRGPANKDGTPGDLLIPPNPQKAFELFQSVIQYHVPKLAATDLAHTGTVNFRNASELSDDELANIATASRK